MLKKQRLVNLIEIAMVSAVALVLSYIPIGSSTAGFDLSLGLLPVAFLAVQRGVISAASAGFLAGIMSIIVGKSYFLTTIQVLIEFPIAFASAGLIGIFRKKIFANNKTLLWIIISAIIGVSARWFWHFLAGVIFWGSYAPKGVSSVWYSLVVNGSSAIANIVMISILLIFLAKKYKSFF